MTLALAYDVDAISKAGLITPGGSSSCRTTARRTPPRSSSSSAKGNPKGIKRLERPGEARRPGDYAESENLGRRALELSRRVGIREAAEGRKRRQGEGIRRRLSTRTSRFSTPAPADRRRPSSSAASATCSWRGRTRRTWRWRSQGQSRHRRAVDQHSRRAVGRGRGQGRRQARHARGGTRVSGVSVLTRRSGDCGEEPLPAARSESRGANMPPRSRKSRCSRSMRLSADGTRRRKRTSPTAERSTRSTALEGDSSALHVRMPGQTRTDESQTPYRAAGLPADAGLYAFLFVPHRPGAAADAALCAPPRLGGAPSGRRSATRASSRRTASASVRRSPPPP